MYLRNADEREIKIFKDHFIAGIYSTDSYPPIQNWDRILEQTDITLNLLQTSRLNPKLLSYAKLNDTFNYNITPMPPPRHHNPSAWKTAHQGQLGTTRPRNMLCTSGNAAISMSYIVHTQESIGTNIQHDRTLPSEEETTKPFPSRYSNNHGSQPHRSPPEPIPIHPHPETWWEKKKRH